MSMASAILAKISTLDPASALEEEHIAMSATGMAYAGENPAHPLCPPELRNLAHRAGLQLAWTRWVHPHDPAHRTLR